MKDRFFRVAVLLLILGFWVNSSAVLAASADLQKAKQESEAKGFIFETSHDEIVAKAKKEGKLWAFSSEDPEIFRAMADLMKKKYPFLDIKVQQSMGSEAQQRFLLELKAGTVDWDLTSAATDMYNDYVLERKKFDILGMAQQGVLAIDPRMVDPDNRGVVSVSSTLCCVAYSKKLISPEKLPNTWDDFLRPEFKGGKFLVDIRPTCLAGMAAGLGEKWVVDYAKKIAAQMPVWSRGYPIAYTRIAAGEYALHFMGNYNSCLQIAAKDPTDSLMCKVVEPVPVRPMDNDFVIRTAPHPYAALLWIEMEASPEGQRILDDYGPVKSSVFAQGKVAEAVKGRKIIVNDFRTLKNTTRWQEMAVEAFGFPTAKIK